MTFKTFVDSLFTIGNTIVIPFIFTLTFLVFVWGIFKYLIWGGDSEESRAEGRQFAVWGVLGMVVLVSVWGIVNLLLSTLGIAP